MAQLSDIEFTNNPALPVLPKLKFLHDGVDVGSPARSDYLIALNDLNVQIDAAKKPTPKNFFEKLCLDDAPRKIGNTSVYVGLGFMVLGIILGGAALGVAASIIGLAVFFGGPLSSLGLALRGVQIKNKLREKEYALSDARQDLYIAECDRLRQQLKARLPEIAAQQKMLAAIHAERDALFTQLNKLGQTAQLLCEGEVSPAALKAGVGETSGDAAAMIAQVAEPIARPAVLPAVNRPARLRTNIGTNTMPQA